MGTQSKAKSLAGRDGYGTGSGGSGGLPSVATDDASTNSIGQYNPEAATDDAGREAVPSNGEAARSLNVPMYTGAIRRSFGHKITVQLRRADAEQLTRLVRGLEDAGATLTDGRIVSDRTKAVRWLLENIRPETE